jgi:hypothetical protein
MIKPVFNTVATPLKVCRRAILAFFQVVASSQIFPLSVRGLKAIRQLRRKVTTIAPLLKIF